MFADLHCHPSNRSFNTLRNSSADPWIHTPPNGRQLNQTIWYQNPGDKKKKRDEMIKGFPGEMASFPQCDMRSLSDSETRLVFAALYPIERGFVMGREGSELSAKSFTALVDRLLQKKRLGFLARILKPFTLGFNLPVNLLINNPGPVRDWLQTTLMRFSKNRINFFQGRKYDYFTEVGYEHDFYMRGSDQVPPVETSCKPYKLIGNGEELRQVMEAPDGIAIVLTLEGMHMLSQELKDRKLTYVGWERLRERLATIKSWNVFFVTFSHHYDNELAGHARSLPQLLQEITNQVPRRHTGITEEGWKAIRFLLSINENGDDDPATGKRVLIDLKHMAAKARNEYYTVARAYNQRHPDRKIPFIASHVGYANRKTLVELIDCAEGERDSSFKDHFYQWNINICDEEIRFIVESGGMIGLSFDQRIVGISLAERPATPKDWAWYLTNNVLAFARACLSTSMTEPERVWRCIGLGTDFDGFIDPVNHFGTAERFGYFMTTFREHLRDLDATTLEYLRLAGNPFTIDQVADMIAWKNAYAFALRNLTV